MLIKRVLVALSGTPFTSSAVQRAIELAKLHDAELTGVTLIDVDRIEHVGPVPIGGSGAAQELREQRVTATRASIDEAIRDFESACREARIVACLERATGDPFATLIELWRYHDIMVFGMRGLFDYGVVHHPDDMVLRMIAHDVQPIVCVSEEHRPIRKVVIGYNGSMESARAMKRFIVLNPWPDISIHIVCLGRDARADALLGGATEYCRAHGITPETTHLKGADRHRLLTFSEELGADLIVMGASSRARILQRILGSTTLEAIRRAEIPLFLAH